jgi:ABC-type uncharacterized transport system permease subunit
MNMQGSIRFVVGLMLVIGAVGGIELGATDYELYIGIVIAIIGLIVMGSGARAFGRNE